MAMIRKIQHNLISLILWLSVLLLITYGLFSFIPKNNGTSQHSLSSRRTLAGHRSFDFTPFLRHQRHLRRHHHHHHHVLASNEPAGSEVDPRYGVEKRLVPSGPNPLHH